MGLPPSAVVLLGEVVSPGSHALDRTVTPIEYAAAGITSHWRLELEPQPLLVVHRLTDGAYAVVQSVATRGAVVLPLGEPGGEVVVELDLPSLLRTPLD